jgi:hypothetical protein
MAGVLPRKVSRTSTSGIRYESWARTQSREPGATRGRPGLGGLAEARSPFIRKQDRELAADPGYTSRELAADPGCTSREP